MRETDRRLLPAGFRLAIVLLVVIGLIGAVGVGADYLKRPPHESPAALPLSVLPGEAAKPGTPGPGGDPARRTLILYNDAGESAEVSHSDAIQAANLASRGGAWTMRPVELYRAGEISDYQAVIYVGRDTPDPLPPPFLADIVRSDVPVLWMGDNIEQLFAAQPSVTATYGWRPAGEDTINVPVIEYAGQRLLRRTDETLNRIEFTSGSTARSLGTALHADGSSYPWAVSARNLTYVGEVPFSYVDTRDRYLAGADLIQRLVAPQAPDRKRALIRIEDVGPNTNPDQIRAIADLLAARGVPFSLATYPYYRDPNGAVHEGEPVSFRLVDVPEMVDALRYAQERGGTIIMHGYTHQYESAINPYSGQSGADYEFYMSHVDAQDNVQLDGPVPADSREWMADRLAVGRAEFVRVGLPEPTIFEFPHYMGSELDYRVVHELFGMRYDQGTYFTGQCPRGECGTPDVDVSSRFFQQYFPYPVRDIYGSVVIPENLENISEPYNNNPARSAQDLIAGARALTVIRDSVASAFFHPFLPLRELEQLIDGIEAEGFRFVSPHDIVRADER